jgi:small-conductance mechanosensitive channel
MYAMYLNLFAAGAILVAGYILARVVRTITKKLFKRLGAIKYKKLAGQIVFYVLQIIFLFCALNQLGFDLNVLLGAAGIFSVAIGFASQTSASNFISGIFLIFERVIAEGDTITVDGITGEVFSVDLLSTKLRTPDNLFIRIPNETLIKSKLANLSRFSKRRLDLIVMFPYEQSLPKIQSLWFSMIEKNSFCLKDPPPDVTISSIAQDCVSILLSVWVEEKNYAKLKNELQKNVLQAFAEDKIIPYISYAFKKETPSKHDNPSNYS